MAFKRAGGAKQFSLDSLPMEVQKALVDSDDRSAVLVGGALLDKCLEDYFRVLMIDKPKEVNKLFNPKKGSALLVSSYAKIELAYFMGAISSNERNDLNVIRHIRNEFAHNILGCTFSDTDVQAHCKKFVLCWAALKTLNVQMRIAFNTEIYVLLSVLNSRRLKATRLPSPAELVWR